MAVLYSLLLRVSTSTENITRPLLMLNLSAYKINEWVTCNFKFHDHFGFVDLSTLVLVYDKSLNKLDKYSDLS